MPNLCHLRWQHDQIWALPVSAHVSFFGNDFHLYAQRLGGSASSRLLRVRDRAIAVALASSTGGVASENATFLTTMNPLT